MSTMTRWNNDDIASNFMTKEQVKRICPLVFSVEPTRNVSGKYIIASTETVIDDMERLGWKIVEAHQRKASSRSQESGQQFSYHQIIFQNPDIKITKTVNGVETVESYPRIILGNSHDGCNAFRFAVGLLRLVCSNGTIIASQKFADLRIIHMNYSFEELRELVNKIIAELPAQVIQMNKMQNTVLTQEQKNELALEAVRIRFDDEEREVDEETISEILEPLRDEDKEDSLWVTFNIIQEKMIKGGFSVSNFDEEGNTKVRKVRKITSFITDMDINKKLWRAAEKYLPEELEVQEEAA